MSLQLIVVSLRQNDTGYTHSIVDQLNLDNGETTRIVSGQGIFIARFDRRGRLYWRLGQQSSPGLPSWVLLNP